MNWASLIETVCHLRLICKLFTLPDNLGQGVVQIEVPEQILDSNITISNTFTMYVKGLASVDLIEMDLQYC